MGCGGRLPTPLEEKPMLKKIVSKEYAGYYEIVPTRISRLIEFFQSSRLTLRPIVIAMMFLSSFIQFGANPVKAVMVSVAAYVMMALPIGGRYIERLGMIVFVIAVALWLELVPFKDVFTRLWSGSGQC